MRREFVHRVVVLVCVRTVGTPMPDAVDEARRGVVRQESNLCQEAFYLQGAFGPIFDSFPALFPGFAFATRRVGVASVVTADRGRPLLPFQAPIAPAP